MDLLKELFSSCNDGWLTIWNMADKQCCWFKVPDGVNAAQEYAIQHKQIADIFFGVCPRKERLGPNRRGTGEDINFISTLFADIDILDQAHKSSALPKDQHEALNFIGSLDIQPSCIVSSGHGLHIYWILEAPVNITDSSRDEIQRLMRGWQGYINNKAADCGWQFDRVGDLARVLRVPGTLNHKTDLAQPVEVIAESEYRYCLDNFNKLIKNQSGILARSKTVITETIPQGTRNDTLFRSACSMRARGSDKKEINECLQQMNRDRCETPLSANELDSIIRSSCKYEKGEGNNRIIKISGIPVEGLRESGWSVDINGVRRIRCVKDKPLIEEACPHPIIISEILRNMDTGLEKARISFLKDSIWRSFTVNRSFIASPRSIIMLADHGIMVTSENAKLLVGYLSSLEKINMDVIPRKTSIGRLGWVGSKTFSPYSAEISFDGDMYCGDIYRAVRTKGDEKEWMALVGVAREDIFTRAILNASCASPLIIPLGKLPFILHLWGNTGTGKTAALHFAAGIWGDPRHLIRTFNATDVGLEKASSFLHSIPLLLDELQVRNETMNLDGLIYMLTEGRSRARGTKEGGAESMASWGNVIISTGEEPITGERSNGGARNRVIELNITKDLFGGKASRAASIADANYGFLGKKIVQLLIQEYGSTPGDLRQLYQSLREYIEQNNSASKYTDKQLTALALLGTADILASCCIGDTAEDAQLKAEQFMDSFLKLLTSSVEVDQAERGKEWLMSWLSGNMEHFETSSNFREPRFGIVDKGESAFFVATTVLNDAIRAAGFNPLKLTKSWADDGLIARQNDSAHIGVQKKINGINVRCYKILLPEYEPE